MFKTMEEIKAATLKSRCRNWFEESSMEFFNTILYPEVFPTDKGSYFITSEQREDDTPRLFSVRFCSNDGLIETIGDFRGYTSSGEAKAAIKYITRFQWKLEVPLWAVYRFMDIKERWRQGHEPMDDGIHMTGWKATPKGGKLIYSSDSVEYMIQLYK